MRKSILRSLAFTAALTMMLTVSASAESATVTGNGVNIRSGPGVSYPVVDCLAKGETVTVTDCSNNSWYAVNYNGTEGFMSSSYLNMVQTASSEASADVTVTASSESGDNGYINAMYVRFRSGPGSSYSVLGEYSTGKTVTINGISNGWASVTIDGTSGYVYGQYVTEGLPSSGSNGSVSAVSVTATADSSQAAETTPVPTATPAPVATPAADPVDENAGTVSGDYVRFRSGPGSGYSILATCTKGTALTILSQLDSGWCEVNINGTVGYMYGQYISRTQAASSATETSTAQAASSAAASATADTSATTVRTGYITGNNVRLRSGPSSQTDVITELYFGNAVTITGSTNGWTAVSYNGSNGYVYGSYVQEGASVVTSGTVTATTSGTASTDTSTASTNSGSKTGNDIASFALTLVGSKYCWGGADPSTGFDCSGFVSYVYKQNGYTINRVAADQALNGTHVDPADLQPGDILCFYSGNDYIGHVGIYIGDGKFVHSSNSSTGVIVSSLSGYYVTRGYEARRVAG